MGKSFFSNLLAGLLGLLGQENSLDVGKYTTLGDGYTSQQFVQLLVVTHGQLKMTGDDPALLVVTGSVTRQLEDLSRQVLHNGGGVNWGSGSYALGIVSFPQMTMNSSDGELKSGPAGSGLCFALSFTTFATSRHDNSSMLAV